MTRIIIIVVIVLIIAFIFQQTAANKKRGEQNRVQGQQFLQQNMQQEGVQKTASGLQYKVLQKGAGTVRPKASDSVKVHYHGTLIDGTVFDSSVDRGEPISFALNQVIKGWTEGLQLMVVGEKTRLYIPSELAYGNRQAGAIKPGSTLIFDVELLAINE